MSTSDITVDRRVLKPHIATHRPEFAHPTVLASEPWEYVALYLRRRKKDDALFFWRQSQSLYEATAPLPPTSSPITAYYCCLNATKALLSASQASSAEYHGLHGESLPGKAVLQNEVVKTKQNGVFPALARYLGEPEKRREYTLHDLLQSIVFVHRAFCLTYRSSKDLYIPLDNPKFVRLDQSKKSWFCAQVPKRYRHQKVLETLPPGYERDEGITDSCVIRRKARFDWQPRKEKEASLRNLTRYHRSLRKDVRPIISTPTRWYIRRTVSTVDWPSHSELPATLAILHRLSELARYRPLVMSKHLDGQHGWLLGEFLKTAPAQFVQQIASELTGFYFYSPSAASLAESPRS